MKARRPTPGVLWHYTCLDHAAPEIDATGELRPTQHILLPQLGPIVWLTDIPDPAIGCGLDILGIAESVILTCDRLAVRYAVEAAAAPGLARWVDVRGRCDPDAVEALEEGGSWPSRWWIATGPVPIGTPAQPRRP